MEVHFLFMIYMSAFERIADPGTGLGYVTVRVFPDIQYSRFCEPSGCYTIFLKTNPHARRVFLLWLDRVCLCD